MKRFKTIAILLSFVAATSLCSRATAEEKATASPDPADFRAVFLDLCDLAVGQLNIAAYTPFDESHRKTEDPKTHHYPFFEDSYGVRALCVAYDVTGRREYLDACTRWADRVIDDQQRMTPKGAYFLNYVGGRQPGQTAGDWWVADSGSIAMAVLATAVRTKDAEKRDRYLQSIRAFARLVVDNYVGKDGGITDGIWSHYSGEYWCSTFTFGAFMFLAHAETKDPEYLKVGLAAMDWVNRYDFRKDSKPQFAGFYPCMVFYCYEFYAAALPFLEPGSPRRQAAESHIAEGLQWLAANQKGRGAKFEGDYLINDDVYMSGNPYFMYVFARRLPQHGDLAAETDRELRYVGELLYKDGKPRVPRLQVWELMTFAMMSYAERLSPGSLFRTSQP